jgi:hypothetical protein
MEMFFFLQKLFPQKCEPLLGGHSSSCDGTWYNGPWDEATDIT